MSYLSLARKYRPRRFNDMVGQESSAVALSNAIKLGREPHSVLFTGVRGVGKTTIARIYAKALNCEKGPTIEPCGICLSCQAVQEGNHEDVLEIDGASNTGVDDIRALQETLGYVPQRSKYKVYIIDEVHMLSTNAFNALLKTLEEPPDHVVFVFATTELHKVPETIQSRCQTFHLKKISRDVIFQRLSHILKTENIPFDDSAVRILAREGRGSLRDALTALDQAIALGEGSVTSETLLSVYGKKEDQLITEFLSALLMRSAQGVLEQIAEWDQGGRTMTSLVEGFVKCCRNAMILKEINDDDISINLLDLEERQKKVLNDLANKTNLLDLNRLFRSWVKCLDDLRHADLDRYVVENYALEWCLDPGLPDLQNFIPTFSENFSQPVAGTISTNLNRETSQISSVKENALIQQVQPSIPLKDRWKLTTNESSGKLEKIANVENHISQISNQDNKVPYEEPAKPEKQGYKEESIRIENQSEKRKINPDQYPDNKVSGPAPVTHNLINHPVNFPSGWRELVDEWKTQKPLQARVLEETFVINFGKDRITLAVDPGTMAGSKLLQAEARKKVQAQLEQMFGFTGVLEIQPKPQNGVGDAEMAESDAGGESLLQTKQRERDLARASLKQQIQEHPITKELICQFGGTIEAIELA